MRITRTEVINCLNIICFMATFNLQAMQPDDLLSKIRIGDLREVIKVVGVQEPYRSSARGIINKQYGETIRNVIKHRKFLEDNEQEINRHIGYLEAQYVRLIRSYVEVLKNKADLFMEAEQWFITGKAMLPDRLLEVLEIVVNDIFKRKSLEFEVLTYLNLSIWL